MNEEITKELQKRGVTIVRFVDISKLSEKQTQGLTKAILFCMPLSQKFILDVHENLPIKHDEFIEKEEMIPNFKINNLCKYFSQAKIFYIMPAVDG